MDGFAQFIDTANFWVLLGIQFAVFVFIGLGVNLLMGEKSSGGRSDQSGSSFPIDPIAERYNQSRSSGEMPPATINTNEATAELATTSIDQRQNLNGNPNESVGQTELVQPFPVDNTYQASPPEPAVSSPGANGTYAASANTTTQPEEIIPGQEYSVHQGSTVEQEDENYIPKVYGIQSIMALTTDDLITLGELGINSITSLAGQKEEDLLNVPSFPQNSKQNIKHWIKQAQLIDSGRFDALEEYQSNL